MDMNKQDSIPVVCGMCSPVGDMVHLELLPQATSVLLTLAWVQTALYLSAGVYV